MFESRFMRNNLVFQAIRDKLKLRNTFGDKIIISDMIEIYEGTPQHKEKLLVRTKGHIVDYGLINITNFLAAGLPNTTYQTQFPSYQWTSKTTYMRVGTGGGTTTHATTALTTPDATAASSQAGATSNPTGGQYRVSWSATWNAGAIAALSVTEVAIWLEMLAGQTALQAFMWIPPQAAGSLQFFSRISEADGDFAHFTINTAVPLTIQWNLTFAFA